MAVPTASAVNCTYFSDENATWHYSCDEGYWQMNDAAFLCLATVAHLILMFISRIDNSEGSIRRFLGGHPGIIFPLNMLDGYENRAAYCAAFGSMTFELTSILYTPYGRFTSFAIGWHIKDDPLITTYPVLRIMLLLVQVGLCTYMFYPLFFCLATKHKFTGAIIGIVLSSYKFCSFAWTASCTDLELDILSANFKVKKYLLTYLLVPCIICMGVLLWQYIMILIWCVRNKNFGEYKIPEPIALPHHIEHVKYLLGKQPLPWSEKRYTHVSMFDMQKFKANFMFSRLPGFRFPTRVMATFVVTVLAVYQIGVQVGFLVYSLLKVVRRFVRCGSTIIPEGLLPFSLADKTAYILKYANYAANTWLVTLAFTCILAVIYVYHMCLCYRKHTLRVYRGDRAIFPKNWIRESNHNMLSAASRHAGLQIAYTIWGFVVIQVVIFIFVCVIVFVICVPAFEFGYWKIITYILQIVLAPIILNMMIYYIQVILNRLLFLQGKINPTDEKVPLSIDNRKAWYNVSFFFFFWNLFLGVISALMRILKGLFLGIFFIPRIDRPVLMRGFETMDNGFYSYLSLLSVINAHDHPVVKVFVKVLMDGVRDKSMRHHSAPDFSEFGVKKEYTDIARVESGSNHHHSLGGGNSVAGSKRAKYYWHLAYTLIHNPDLLNYRKVEVEGEDRIDGIVRNHKIVLAIHRKQQGEATSDLYRDSEGSDI